MRLPEAASSGTTFPFYLPRPAIPHPFPHPFPHDAILHPCPHDAKDVFDAARPDSSLVQVFDAPRHVLFWAAIRAHPTRWIYDMYFRKDSTGQKHRTRFKYQAILTSLNLRTYYLNSSRHAEQTHVRVNAPP